MNALTWWECEKLKPGDRVRFVERWDIFPYCSVDAGELATVVKNQMHEMFPPTLVLKLDNEEIQKALDEWDGDVHLYGPEGTNSIPAWRKPSPIEKVHIVTITPGAAP